MPEISHSVIFAYASTGIDTSVLDREALLDRVGGDEELLREVIGIFFEEYPVLVAEIRVAAAHNDALNLERAAHSLKGSVANFGAHPATDIARDLELIGRKGKVGGLAPLVSRLEEELASLHGALAELLEASQAAN